MNDDCDFEKIFKRIYLPELILKKENTSNMKASFLDLDINVKRREFEAELYDKRGAFFFSVDRMSYLYSNKPIRTFYAAVGCEILSLLRITFSKEKF